MKATGSERLRKAFKLFKEALSELEKIEYIVELLEKEIQEYEELLDKEAFIPKAKFVKQKIVRLIERLKYSPEHHILGIGVKLSCVGVPKNEEKELLNQIIVYLDGRIRPGDLLFKFSDSSIGMIFFVEDKNSSEAILERIKSILMNLKAQTYSSQKILINFKIKRLDVTPEMSADEVFEKLMEE